MVFTPHASVHSLQNTVGGSSLAVLKGLIAVLQINERLPSCNLTGRLLPELHKHELKNKPCFRPLRSYGSRRTGVLENWVLVYVFQEVAPITSTSKGRTCIAVFPAPKGGPIRVLLMLLMLTVF